MLKKAALMVPVAAVAYQFAPELNDWRLQANARLVEPLASRWWLHVQGDRERALLKGLHGRVLELEPRCGETLQGITRAGTGEKILSWTGLSTNPYLEQELYARAADAGFPAGCLELIPLRTAEAIRHRRRDVHNPLDELLDAGVPRTETPGAEGRAGLSDEAFWADGVTFGGAYEARFGQFLPIDHDSTPISLPAGVANPQSQNPALRQPLPPGIRTANHLLLEGLKRLPTASYDSLVARRVLARCTNQAEMERLVAEMHRVLRPGGRLILVERTARSDSTLMRGLQWLGNQLRLPNLRGSERWTLRPLEAVLKMVPSHQQLAEQQQREHQQNNSNNSSKSTSPTPPRPEQRLFETAYVESWPDWRDFRAGADPRRGVRVVKYQPQPEPRRLVGPGLFEGDSQHPDNSSSSAEEQAIRGEIAPGTVLGGISGVRPLIALACTKAWPLRSGAAPVAPQDAPPDASQLFQRLMGKRA